MLVYHFIVWFLIRAMRYVREIESTLVYCYLNEIESTLPYLKETENILLCLQGSTNACFLNTQCFDDRPGLGASTSAKCYQHASALTPTAPVHHKTAEALAGAQKKQETRLFCAANDWCLGCEPICKSIIQTSWARKNRAGQPANILKKCSFAISFRSLTVTRL